MMKNRILSIIVLVALVLCMVAGCGSKEPEFLTAEDAQKIAVEAAGVSEEEVTDVHAHAGSYEDAPCFSIHLTLSDGTEYEYIIDAFTGEILN